MEARKCPQCSGFGQVVDSPGREPLICPTCNGSGEDPQLILPGFEGDTDAAQ